MHLISPLLATIPAPPFRDFEIGGATLHGYGLVMGIAIVVGINIFEWALKRQHVDTSRLTPFLLIAIVAGFIGARLYHVASEPQRFMDAPGDIIKIWEGGLGIYGAVFGGVLVGGWIAPRFGLPRRAAIDAAAPAFLFAQAIGRLGNYLNQELFGRPFNGPWALEVDPEHRPLGYLNDATFHPTFLYEAIGTLLLGFVFVMLVRRWTSRPPGILFPLYVAAYSLLRLMVEPLRIDSAHEWLGMRQNVWVAGVLVIAGLAAAAIMYRRERRHA
ncbi:MAG: prolipoprotein diacylglyceryl transferase [Gaiellales bacterium]